MGAWYKRKMRQYIRNSIDRYGYYFIFAFSFLSFAGSLAFSELAGFAPCLLCWWQRIFMYPILFISLVGIIRKDHDFPFYVAPLSIIGGLVALYQNLLIWKIIPEKLAPCTTGISCIDQQFALFGFITIPLLSFIAFAAIATIIIHIIIRKTYETRN